MKINFNIFKHIDTKAQNAQINFNINKNNEIYKKIEQELPSLQRVIKDEKFPLTFLEKDSNVTLMNYGPFTTVLRNKDLDTNIAVQMYDHIYKVKNLNK